MQNVDKFRHYLIGKKFLLRTDNRVLTYLKTTHTSKSLKLLNWAMTLIEYDYDVVHIPSKNNEIADCLSRLYEKLNVISQLEPIIPYSEILLLQKKDEEMKNALDYVLCESKKSFAVQSLGCLKRFRKQLHVND